MWGPSPLLKEGGAVDELQDPHQLVDSSWQETPSPSARRLHSLQHILALQPHPIIRVAVRVDDLS